MGHIHSDLGYTIAVIILLRYRKDLMGSLSILKSVWSGSSWGSFEYKIENICMRETALDWFRSFLFGRTGSNSKFD